MGRCMKILAILALVATIAGAGAVLYGINTLRPQVVQTAASETRAQDAADTFAALVSQLENNTFGGKIFGGTGDLRAEECTFVTYTVRLKNRGFFPAEWISMELLEPAEGDVLALNATTLAGKLLQLSNGAVYDEFHNIRVIHDKKLDALEDLIEAANGKPVLVMYAYQHDLTRIQQRFGKHSPENPTGVRELKTSADLEDWNAGKIAVAVTQPASTGHGLNLQHGGSTIVWFGLNWSLELYEQANACLWRQGQKETVVVHHLVVKGTMDEQVMRALHEKAADQNALLAAVKARIQNTKSDQ